MLLADVSSSFAIVILHSHLTTVILSFYRIVLFCIVVYHASVHCTDFTGI